MVMARFSEICRVEVLGLWLWCLSGLRQRLDDPLHHLRPRHRHHVLDRRRHADYGQRLRIIRDAADAGAEAVLLPGETLDLRILEGGEGLLATGGEGDQRVAAPHGGARVEGGDLLAEGVAILRVLDAELDELRLIADDDRVA